ncbi:hypothetical protein AB0I30_21095 [Nocardia tengchongensis]|uniref:hypothetical protein n=1 Tax=Nocardia tengchongensis TaxID=2055889 RepID=UPI0033C44D53
MSAGGRNGHHRGLSLEAVHWHLAREDAQRTAVSTRAGAVLSANTLVVAGVALAISLKGPNPLSLWVITPAFGALVLVGGSVVHATQALVMLRNTERRFSEPRTAASTLYGLSRISKGWASFDEFRSAVLDQSPEQQLRGALDELWRASHLHLYRYRKLRKGTWFLLLAIGMLLITVTAAALLY